MEYNDIDMLIILNLNIEMFHLEIVELPRFLHFT